MLAGTQSVFLADTLMNSLIKRLLSMISILQHQCGELVSLMTTADAREFEQSIASDYKHFVKAYRVWFKARASTYSR